MANGSSFLTMLNAAHQLSLATEQETIKEEDPAIPPWHGFSVTVNPFFAALSPKEIDLMTNGEEHRARFDTRQLHRMASLLMSDSDFFLAIASTEHGSKCLQQLLGKSDDADRLFASAIMRRFLDFMTDKHASYVAVRAMRVFDKVAKTVMFHYTLHYALDLARDQHGCVALNEIITDASHFYYRNCLFDIIAQNALVLSHDAYGNSVIQHLLKLNDLRCTNNIGLELYGHCVDLSSTKHGSYIVEQLLEATEISMVLVVVELLECEVDRFERLWQCELGISLLGKALRLTKEMSRFDLFKDLKQKI